MRSFIFEVCAHINPILLVLGSICVALMLTIAAALVTLLLAYARPSLRRWREWGRHLPMAVLRTATALLGMAAELIAASVANRVWIRRLRSMDAYDAEDFCGKGIPRKDWAVFLDQMADLLWEMRGSGKRQP